MKSYIDTFLVIHWKVLWCVIVHFCWCLINMYYLLIHIYAVNWYWCELKHFVLIKCCFIFKAMNVCSCCTEITNKLCFGEKTLNTKHFNHTRKWLAVYLQLWRFYFVMLTEKAYFRCVCVWLFPFLTYTNKA